MTSLLAALMVVGTATADPGFQADIGPNAFALRDAQFETAPGPHVVDDAAKTTPSIAAAGTRTLINDPAWNDASSRIDTSRPRASHPARLVNISLRAMAGSSGNTLIAGAVVRGAGTVPTLVRAIGPGLAQFGVTNTLADPELVVFHGDRVAAQTNTLGDSAPAVSAYVGAFPALPSANGVAVGDAALVGRPAAGTLTAHCTGSTGNSGVALLEFYDTEAAASPASARFVNFSSRARVETGEGILVVGFVIAGEGELKLLLRAVGATLEQFNVAGALGDPVIELYAGNALIATNDNWRSGGPDGGTSLQDAARAAGAFDLVSSNDAAMLVTLRAGAYTLHVRGAGGQSGVALTEIYEAVDTGEFDAARATNAVGLDLFRQLATTSPGQNVVISPYSIESALALAYAGAAGDTREEMARALRFPNDNASLQSGFAGLRSALAAVAEQSIAISQTRSQSGVRTDPIEWQAANRLFGQQGYPFRASFVTLMNDGFAAPFEPMDFRTETERSRLTINAWVEEQTRQKIVNLIPSGGLSELTRLVLVNALYLKAPWDKPFEKSNTTPRAFHPMPGSSRDVPTMQRTEFSGYATEEGLTIVTLDYLGSGLQFVIALPDENQTVDTAAARLTSEHFERWAKLGQNGRRNVALALPKFKVEGATVPLGVALRAIGVKSAFDVPLGSANFDGIAPRRPDDYLAISDVFHQTFIAVDEEGTEAAAATAVVAGVTSAPPPPIEVQVDRPFLFAIQHRASGVCLFLGRITDPR